MMYFLEAFQRAAKYFGHYLGVFSDVAVPAGVRMPRLKEQDVASVHVPTAALTKRGERAVVQQLPPMTLAVPKRVVRSLTAGKVAVCLGSEDRREASAGIVLRGVSDAPTAVEPGPSTSLIPADALFAVEGSQRTKRLALL
jgi:hypothetical protein